MSAYSQNNFASISGRAVRCYVFGNELGAQWSLVTVSAYSQNNFREEQYAVMLLVTVLCLPIRKSASKALRESITAEWAWTALIPKDLVTDSLSLKFGAAKDFPHRADILFPLRNEEAKAEK